MPYCWGPYLFRNYNKYILFYKCPKAYWVMALLLLCLRVPQFTIIALVLSHWGGGQPRRPSRREADSTKGPWCLPKKRLLMLEFKSLKIRSLYFITPIFKGSGKGASRDSVIITIPFDLSPRSFGGEGKETNWIQEHLTFYFIQWQADLDEANIFFFLDLKLRCLPIWYLQILSMRGDIKRMRKKNLTPNRNKKQRLQ